MADRISIESALEILGVEPDSDRKQIRRAYLKKIKSARPERDPEGFRRVRDAYELLAGMADAGSLVGWSSSRRRQPPVAKREEPTQVDRDEQQAPEPSWDAEAPADEPIRDWEGADASSDFDAEPPPDSPEMRASEMAWEALELADEGELERATEEMERAYALLKDEGSLASLPEYAVLQVVLSAFGGRRQDLAWRVANPWLWQTETVGLQTRLTDDWSRFAYICVRELASLNPPVPVELSAIMANGVADGDLDKAVPLIKGWARANKADAKRARGQLEQQAPSLAATFGEAVGAGADSEFPPWLIPIIIVFVLMGPLRRCGTQFEEWMDARDAPTDVRDRLCDEHADACDDIDALIDHTKSLDCDEAKASYDAVRSQLQSSPDLDQLLDYYRNNCPAGT